MSIEVMTSDEVQTFAAKLEEFGLALSAKERAVLQEILYRAAAAGDEDVEGHLDLHASIAATTLAVAAALGLTAANTAVTTAQAPRTQPPFHTTGQSQHHSGQWVVDDKGGMEYVP